MNRADSSGIEQNEAGTIHQIDTDLTQPRSGPVRYEVIDKESNVVGGTFPTATAATAQAMKWWPDEPQDEERAGNGWDIQIVGVHRDEP
jgi:hypothetical protein